MPAVANIAFRATFSITVLAALVACGSEGEAAGPYGDGGFPGLGFVGSGGRGGNAGGNVDASVESGPGAPGRDGGDAGGEGDEGGETGLDAGGQDAGEGTAGDGGSQVGVTFNLPPGFFPSLSWQISGPGGVYSGTVYFGDARSLEFVVGGIVAGSGYTIALEGTDRDGMPCSGTSAPFDVVAGQVSGAGVLLTCAPPSDAAEPAPVITGSVGVDAAVTFGDL